MVERQRSRAMLDGRAVKTLNAFIHFQNKSSEHQRSGSEPLDDATGQRSGRAGWLETVTTVTQKATSPHGDN